jgi:GTP-binding protein
VLRAHKTIERADVALLLIDAIDGITQQDLHIAGMIQESYKSTVLVVNKWDAIEKDSLTIVEKTKEVREKLDFMDYVPVLFISALTGQRVHTVLETAVRVQEERMVRIRTSELNQIIREALLSHAPQTRQPRPFKIFMAQQVRVDPPTFLFHINSRELLHFTYERYLENQIRKVYPFTGTPIRLSFREREHTKREK